MAEAQPSWRGTGVVTTSPLLRQLHNLRHSLHTRETGAV